MVIHDGVGTQVDGENRTEQFDAIDDPLAAMFKVKAGVSIFATQEGAPDTA